MIGPAGFMAAPKNTSQYRPQWRVENFRNGRGAKRWCVRFVGGQGKTVERLMRNGKERTFLRESIAEQEAAKRNASEELDAAMPGSQGLTGR